MTSFHKSENIIALQG